MNYIKFLLSDTFNVPNGVPGPSDFTVLISRVTNILLFVAGAVAVIFIIVGGFNILPRVVAKIRPGLPRVPLLMQ